MVERVRVEDPECIVRLNFAYLSPLVVPRSTRAALLLISAVYLEGLIVRLYLVDSVVYTFSPYHGR